MNLIKQILVVIFVMILLTTCGSQGYEVPFVEGEVKDTSLEVEVKLSDDVTEDSIEISDSETAIEEAEILMAEDIEEALVEEQAGEDEEMTLKLTVGNRVLTAKMVENSTTEALIEKLNEGPVTIDMRDYASMEKVGPLPWSLPRNDEQIVTEAGDLILYQGSAFVIYYGPNSWNFTRIGKIEGVNGSELKAILGEGDVAVTLSID